MKSDCIQQLKYLLDIYKSQINKYKEAEDTATKEYYSLVGGERALEIAIENIEVLVEEGKLA
mgnify:CR=1 FL=1